MVRMSVTNFLDLAEDIKKDFLNKNSDEYEIALRDIDDDLWYASVYKLPGFSVVS